MAECLHQHTFVLLYKTIHRGTHLCYLEHCVRLLFTSLISETAWMISLASAWRLFVYANKYFKQAFVITRALKKSVVVMANRRVQESVRESKDHLLEPSEEMLSIHATIEGWSVWNLSIASICSIHRVRQRSFNLRTENSGWVVSMASSSFLWRFGWAEKNMEI